MDFLQESCLGILKKEPLSKEIKRLGLDLKEKDGSMRNVLLELFRSSGQRDGAGEKKVRNQSLKIMLQQFLQASEISLIVDNIENNFVDFRKFFLMLFEPLRALKPSSKTLQLLLELVREVTDQLVRRNTEALRQAFEAILLRPLLDVITLDPKKCGHICTIAFCFLG